MNKASTPAHTKAIVCPACHGADLTKISERDSVAAPIMGEGEEIPIRAFAFQCKCGTAFTHTERREAATGGMPASELATT